MRLPSVNTIEQTLRIDRPTARKVRKALEESTYLWRGKGVQSALDKVDSIIGGHGVEYIASSEDTMRAAAGIEYVNMGDTYSATVMYDCDKARFVVGSWGDMVERYPARFAE